MDFAFVGNLRYMPNAVSLRKFFRLGLGPIARQIPEFRLRVIGMCDPGSFAEDLLIGGGNVTFEGFVSDLGTVLNDCRGVLMPIDYGTGIKLKAIEALRFGVPIVSTPVGVEGLDLAHGRECFVESDITKFVRWVHALTSDEIVDVMSRSGQTFYSNMFGDNVIKSMYREIFLGDSGGISFGS
jgi:glycosyltransferase involved in cell wall biosynthesis